MSTTHQTPPAPPPSRWLTRRRGAVLGGLAITATIAIVAVHRHSNRRFLDGVAAALSESASLSADVLSDWFRWRLGVVTPEQQLTVREIVVGPRAPGDSVQVLRLRASRSAARDTTAEVLATEAAFPRLNLAASDDRTQRTALVLRNDAEPRVVLVTAPGGGPRTAGIARSVPEGATLSLDVQHAIASSGGTRVHGIAQGLFGEQVVWAAAPIPGTTLWVLREREAAELIALLRPQLVFSDAVFAALALLLLGILAYRWRAVTMAAERDAVRLRAAFVASVSHELRTPLTQIRMYAEMLRLGFLRNDAESDRALHVIEREAGRLGLLVDRALTFARTGQAPPVATGRAPLADTITRASAAMQPLLAERGATVVHTVAESWDVQCDVDALQQVLINLLDNALKYGPTGQTIRLSASRDRTLTHLTVDDEGPGIPVAERERIWGAFVRGDHDPSIGGSGIGLAIVRDIVVAAGGTASVTERPDGRGARFVVSLPTA